MTFRTFIFTISLFAALPGAAKSTEWLLTPAYERMEPFGTGLYKVTANGKTGLIDSNGHTVLDAEYDTVLDFYEGIAVFGNYDTDGIRIKGTVTEDHSVTHADGTYYLLPDYPFYSEGFITVTDSKGRYGYLNEKCRPQFTFGKDETRPFSEGCAAVGEGDDFHWLTTSGEKIFLSLPNGSFPYGGTNFHNGIAYLWDEYGEDFFVFDASGDVRKVAPRSLEVDYLYRVDTDCGADIVYAKTEPRYDKTWKPSQRNGKWTFSDSHGDLLSTYQYDAVDYFQGETARAKADGKWGLLRIVEDMATFFTQNDDRMHVFTSKKGSDCSFRLSIPEKWSGSDLTVSVKDPETGLTIKPDMKGDNEFTFTYQPDIEKTAVRKTFEIEVAHGDVSLWRGEEHYDFVQAVKLLAALNVRKKADQNNRCLVTATVTNPSPVAVTTTVTLSGGGSSARFTPQTVTITIPANSKRSVTGAFQLKGVELDGWCAVATSDGVQKRQNNLELKPRD